MNAFMSQKVSIAAQRGASAVEFAIVLPVLLLLVFGTIEFGVILFDKAVITNASREGARRGVVWWTDSSGSSFDIDVVREKVRNVVNTYFTDSTDPLNPKPILITFGATNPSPTTEVQLVPIAGTDFLEVRVSYNHDFLILPNFLTRVFRTIVGKTTMRIEY